jgi:signal peptidase II
MSWRHGLVFALIVLFIVTTDQWSKEWIRANIAIGGSLPEVACINMVHVENTGSAFGLFTNQAFLLSIVAIVGLAIVLLFFRYLSELGFAGGVALSLIFGGAMGNLIDRLRLGSVTDFIYVRIWNDVFWPAFNVADSAITIGAISLAVISMIRLKKAHGTESTSANKGN